VGTAQFGLDYGINNNLGKVEFGQVRRILDYAKKSGIDTLDTASGYGDSERVIGDYLQSSDNRFKIITKFSGDLKLSFEKSLANLRVKSIYGCLFHSYNDYKSNPKMLDELIKLKNKNLIKKIGFSLYYPSELEELIDKGVDLDLIQIPYSIFDRRFEGVLLEAKNRQIEVHARSIFLQGLIFKDPDLLDEFFGPVKSQIKKIRNISRESSLSVSAIALGYVYLNKNIDKLVIGIDNLDNLKENVDDLANSNLAEVSLLLPELNQIKITKEEMLLPFKWKTK